MKLPRFTLRELFLLVIIAAMGCGWWVDRRWMQKELTAIREDRDLATSNFSDVRQYFESYGYRFSFMRDGLVAVDRPAEQEVNPDP